MGDSAPDDRMYERIDSRHDRLRLKFLLNLNRYVLTAGLALGVFSVIVGMNTLGEVPLREMMGSSGPVQPAFQTMLLSITTSVTLVVTISQLVLAQELGPLGDQRERMDGELSFREDAEEFLGTVSPPEPNAFLRILISDLIEENGKEVEEPEAPDEAPPADGNDSDGDESTESKAGLKDPEPESEPEEPDEAPPANGDGDGSDGDEPTEPGEPDDPEPEPEPEDSEPEDPEEPEPEPESEPENSETDEPEEPEPDEPEPKDPEEPDETPPANGDGSDGDEPTEPEPEPEPEPEEPEEPEIPDPEEPEIPDPWRR